jgi:hypothetical protein
MKAIMFGGDTGNAWISEVELAPEPIQNMFEAEWNGKVYEQVRCITNKLELSDLGEWDENVPRLEQTAADYHPAPWREREVKVHSLYGAAYLISDDEVQGIQTRKQQRVQRKLEAKKAAEAKADLQEVTCEECGRPMMLAGGVGECDCGYGTFDY